MRRRVSGWRPCALPLPSLRSRPSRTAVLASLSKTGRMVIAHEAVTDFGAGAELAALASHDGFWALDAPVHRVGAPFLPAPYAPNLEQQWLPDAARIAACLRDAAGA